MQENATERIVVVTSTSEGIVPLTPGERLMIREEPEVCEQAAVVDHSFPQLKADDPARAIFERAKDAFANSEAYETIDFAQRVQVLHPTYLPAHVYEELGMNISAQRDLGKCVQKCLETIQIGQRLIKHQVPAPETETPIQPEQVNDLLDMVHYNLADRYMRLGEYEDALVQLKLSQTLPKTPEQQIKRQLKRASLLSELGREGEAAQVLEGAENLDPELFHVLRDRMALDGHGGIAGTGKE